ncbi:DNA mismatch repair protein MutS [Geodia barretti]|uniref:DNA mismatch repair protein MutS n=3 Tax=Geodia barretti TaxID=519541 RepID=A0AA35RB04_GEOBA|nr:DNA mismatch repair protein MutS [Geodia barretti]
MGLSSCPMVEGLLQSSLLRECCITAVPVEWYQERGRGGQQDLSHFHQRYMESGLFSAIVSDSRFSELERSAASALLWYICHTHRHALPHLLPPSPFSQRHHLAIDASTRRALELVSPQQGNSKKSTLLGSLDRTLTAAGARLLRARLTAPLTDVTSINKRLDTVEVFHLFPLHREAVRVQLRSCADVQRTLQKVAIMSCSAGDLRAIQTTLCTAGSILRYMSEVMRPELPASLWTVLVEETTSGLIDLPHLVLELGRAVGEPHPNRCHFISSGYSEEVDRLREKMGENENAVQRLASSLQEQTGVTKLSVVAYRMYGRVFELSRAQAVKLHRFPQLIRIDHTQSKARYTHVDLQTLNSELHSLEADYMEIQDNLFQLLCDKVMAHSEDISSTAASLARLDVATSLGLLAQERRYSRPKVVEEAVFQVEQGVHPVLASSSDPLSHHFVSNDCSLDPHRLWVLTGPNMGGKSTFLRQNSLLVIMAQMGSFVPARRAVVGVADRLFARVGAADNVTKHMSTFHVEMAETANILATATRHSFVVLDEIGRGTSAIEGLAIAESVIQHLSNDIGCRCLVATHYHTLGQDRQALLGPSVGSYQLEAELDNNGGLLRFTYKVKAGRAEHSFGIEVARLAGLPTAVIDNATELLHNKFVTLKG